MSRLFRGGPCEFESAVFLAPLYSAYYSYYEDWSALGLCEGGGLKVSKQRRNSSASAWDTKPALDGQKNPNGVICNAAARLRVRSLTCVLNTTIKIKFELFALSDCARELTTYTTTAEAVEEVVVMCSRRVVEFPISSYAGSLYVSSPPIASKCGLDQMQHHHRVTPPVPSGDITGSLLWYERSQLLSIHLKGGTVKE